MSHGCSRPTTSRLERKDGTIILPYSKFTICSRMKEIILAPKSSRRLVVGLGTFSARSYMLQRMLGPHKGVLRGLVVRAKVRVGRGVFDFAHALP